MPDRNFAAKINEPAEDGEPKEFSVELVARRPVEGLDGGNVVLKLKDGALKSQAEALQAMINLLGVEIRLSKPS